MKRYTVIAVALVGLLSGAWMFSQWLIGAQVRAQMAALQQALQERSDVELQHFDYRHGLRGGELDYAFTYRPLAASPAHAWLALMDMSAELPLSGQLQVRHGPWVWGEGAALAEISGVLRLPAPWQAVLPAHAGRADSLLQVKAVSGWDTLTRLRLALTDYEGPLQLAGEPDPVQLTLRDVFAELHFNAAGDAFDSSIHADALVLRSADEQFALDIAGWQLLSSHQQQRPGLWRGTVSARARTLQLLTETGSVNIDDLVVAHDLGLDGAFLSHELFASVDSLQLLDASLGAGRLVLLLEQVHAAAWSDLMHWRRQLSVPGATAMGTTGSTAFELIIERLLEAQPVLDLQQLSTSLAADHDTSAGLRLQYTGPASLMAFDIFALPAYVEARGQLLTTEQALDALVEQMLVSTPQWEQEAAQQQLAGELMAALARWGFVGDGQGNIGAEAVLRQGELLVNNELAASSADIFNWLLDRMLGGM